jgi:hypothetical protein
VSKVAVQDSSQVDSHHNKVAVEVLVLSNFLLTFMVYLANFHLAHILRVPRILSTWPPCSKPRLLVVVVDKDSYKACPACLPTFPHLVSKISLKAEDKVVMAVELLKMLAQVSSKVVSLLSKADVAPLLQRV